MNGCMLIKCWLCHSGTNGSWLMAPSMTVPGMVLYLYAFGHAKSQSRNNKQTSPSQSGFYQGTVGYDSLQFPLRLEFGLNQYRTIMYGDAHNERDSLVLNVGLPSLESASVVFRYPKQSNNLYKYIAEDSSIDVWRYNHVDGWCAKDLFSIVLADDVPLAQSVDNKYPTVPW